MAGRPTFFKSVRFKDNPALSNIIINAICLKSLEIDKIESSSRFKAYGPKMIPVNNIPIIRGSFNN